MAEEQKWDHINKLDEEFLLGGVTLSEWTTFLAKTKVQLMTEQILFLETANILITEERERKDIVIGAPHHSVGGVKNLPCVEHPDADENSGFIARQIAET